MIEKMGVNSINSKQYNRGLILQLILTGVCKTRIELSKVTNLAKMTVSNIIAEFIEQDIVIECEEELTEVCGRNPIRLQLSDKAPKVIGLLIYRDRIEAVLCSLKLDIIERECISFQHLTAEQLLQYSCDVIDRILTKEKNVLGIGVATIGPVDIRHGVILNPPRFYGIQNVKVLEFLRDRYTFPIVLDHDNNSAALAEKLFGIGKNMQDFIFLGISNGVGSGIISDGQVYHNRRGLAPEMGHISIDCNGGQCVCGSRGCLEMYVSTYVILEKLKKATGKDMDFEAFCKWEGFDAVDCIFEKMISDISVALVSSVNMLQPESIVLGYDCIDWNEKYVNLLEDLINDRKIVSDQRCITVRKAHFGKNAQLLGAVANVVNQAFEGKLLFS